MACCKEMTVNQMKDFEGVPRSTFFCLARMSYQLACAAETYYTGRSRQGWVEQSDAFCEAFTDKVIGMLGGKPPVSDDQLDLLCFKMVHQLTTHV